MGSSTKGDFQKILAERNKQVKIEALEFEIKQRDQKMERMKIELDNLRVENEKLKSQLSK